jgi:hypothetical protein
MDIAVGIPEAHKLVIQRDRVWRLLLLRLGLLLFLSFVEKPRKTLFLRVGENDTSDKNPDNSAAILYTQHVRVWESLPSVHTS